MPSIWRFVYFRVKRNSHVAEDIVSETVIALIDAIGNGVVVEHPAAWLRTVAARRVTDHYRAAARVEHLLREAENVNPKSGEPDPVARHDKELKRETVRDAMDELPDDYRSALEWKYVEKLNVRSIAERLGATEKAAESILFRARGALRKLLQHEFPEHARENATGKPLPKKVKESNTKEAQAKQRDARERKDPVVDPTERRISGHADDFRNQAVINEPDPTYLGLQLPDGT